MFIEITTDNILFGLVVIGIFFIAAGWSMMESESRRRQAEQQRALQMQQLAALQEQANSEPADGGCLFVLVGTALLVLIGYSLFGF